MNVPGILLAGLVSGLLFLSACKVQRAVPRPDRRPPAEDTLPPAQDTLAVQDSLPEPPHDSLPGLGKTLPDPDGAFRDTVHYRLNDTVIHIVSHRYKGDSTLKFLNIHDDENTSVEAAHNYLGMEGGLIMELQYGNVRNIRFNLESSIDVCIYDPNGMFTDIGAYRTLDKHSRVTSESVQRIRAFGDTILEMYDYKQLGYIVTLHNNTEGYFSILSYQPGKDLAPAAAEVYINPAMDPDDFVFVTDRFFFEYLKEREVNAVLQGVTAPNDGSLSVYAAMTGIPYVNIEAQHGHFEENYRMVAIVAGMVREYLKGKHAASSYPREEEEAK